jgi:zinc-binding alcohol dehydrogenase family protein
VSRTGGHRGASLLLIAGAGGVGSIAIQLAKQLAGLRVIATASRPESARWVRELGADDVVDHTRALADQLRDLGVPEVDYLMCLTAPEPYIDAFAAIIKPQGKICLIVEPRGPLPIGTLMRKSATIAWELMFTRALFETPDMIEQHAILDAVADLVERGVVRTTLAHNAGAITAANLRRAHRDLEQGHATGKIVLEGF